MTLDRVLLIQLQQLGDVLLSSVLLEDLRQALPSARIDYLTRAKPAQLLQNNPHLSEVVLYDADHPLRMMGLVRRRRYDAIVDPQSNPRSAQLVLTSGAARRTGFAISGPWKLVYSETAPRETDPGEGVVRERQRLVELLGLPVTPRPPRLYLSSAEREQGRIDAAALGTAPGAPRVGLVLSAGSAPSVWPVDRFAELATRLQRESIAPVVVRTFGDEAEVARFESVTTGVPRADAPEIRRFLGLLSVLDLVVCANSGPAHFAMALGVPTVTLYGPTHARHWSPDLPIAGVVSSPRLHCVACARGEKRTAAGHTCMLEITVDAVHERVRALLAAAPRTKP